MENIQTSMGLKQSQKELDQFGLEIPSDMMAVVIFGY